MEMRFSHPFKLRKQPPLLLLCVLLVAIACTKAPPPHDAPYVTYRLPQALLDYFSAEAGDTLVYRDSVSAILDTVICSRGGISMAGTVRGSYIFFKEEALFHSFSGTVSPYLFGRGSLRNYSTRLSFSDQGRQEYTITELGEGLVRFPFTIGAEIDNGGQDDKTIVRAFYPALVVDGQEFYEVYHVEVKGHSERRSDCDYYIAKGKGIAAIREHANNRLWVRQ